MAIVFYVLGWLTILGGGWVLVNIIRFAGLTSSSDQYAQAGVGLAIIIAGAPALGAMFGGLLLLAIGGVLSRLDTIAKFSRYSAQVLDDTYRRESPAGRRTGRTEPSL